ncbi:hypothetical protein VSR34_01100 [Paraburkholderia sp. JHI2823]|uniref:hypothetical protein n=1 Tax=Paraburkholderia sp. JHI2823 TaxID=3112960 RepID=UPI00316BB134
MAGSKPRAQSLILIVLDAINRLGPLTSAEIAKEIGESYDTVRRAISRAHIGPNQLLYIKDWGEVQGQGYKRPAIYALGKRKDAPYPHLGLHQKYARHWQRRKLKKQIRETGIANPFASLMVQVAR